MSEGGKDFRISGIQESLWPVLVSRLADGRLGEWIARVPEVEVSDSSPLIVICNSTKSAEKVVDELAFFLSGEGSSLSEKGVYTFLPWDTLPFDSLSPTTQAVASRISCLHALLESRAKIVVTAGEALLQKLVSPELLGRYIKEISVGDELDVEHLSTILDRLGYLRSSLVEEPGQMAVRGAVVDFFPADASKPFRLELFGDSIESIRSFDPTTQRSRETFQQVVIVPAREFFLPLEESVFELGASKLPDASLSTISNSIRNRASDLSLPQKEASELLQAITDERIWPGLEHLQPLVAETSSSFWSYVPEHSPIVVCDEHDVLSSLDAFQQVMSERLTLSKSAGKLFAKSEDAYRTDDQIVPSTHQSIKFFVDSIERLSGEGNHLEVKAKVNDASNLRANLLLSRESDSAFSPLREFYDAARERKTSVAIAVSQSNRVRRVQELLTGLGIATERYSDSFACWCDEKEDSESVAILIGSIETGVISNDIGFAVLSDADIFGQSAGKRKVAAQASIHRLLGAAAQLNENDYVVHLEHGVGLYRGLKQIQIEGRVGDFMHLEYADGAKLFVPVENIAKVQKYTGADASRVALNRLGGKQWEKTKKKVRANVVELAGQLLKLYAEREIVEAESFGEPNEDDLNFAYTFPYQETPDQSQAIEDVLDDLSKNRPMDRLVCGDVGYGKTEVALRAAFKAVMAGRQVALLVPTTVLADQHYQTFLSRFSDFPVRVAYVSRFLTSAENKETLAKVASGKVDIIIGTHRLLQRDVSIPNLGLVIVDEEHRFGVAHKERLKKFKKEIHVLTLTATPIPRTLHMSLVGLRDTSIIQTAPCDRQVIRTYVAEYDEQTVREALLREINRSGQAFYIHNRVKNIAFVTDTLRELVPEARIEFAHGQMKDRELEQIMHRFVAHEIDILVSTTIVESGLDIPNANTIIIGSCDMFGLAELYQLRGRVGRSSRRAYAYLLYSTEKKLGVEARKRLKVLQSLDDLGVGFRLAIQDMEIRGAGNLLGKDQSGHVQMVGYELYSQILKEAIEELRNEEQKGDADQKVPKVEPEVRIGFPAHIPPHYIPDVRERLILYQRLVSLRDKEETFALGEEISDRFGNMPEDVERLLDLMYFRAVLKKYAVTEASLRDRKLRLTLHTEVSVDPEAVVEVIKSHQGRVTVTPSKVIIITLNDNESGEPESLGKLVESVLQRTIRFS